MSDKQLERYRVLCECLTVFEADQRRFSRNESMLEPKPGYERPWEETKKRREILKEMLIEVRYDGNQAEPAAANAAKKRD